MIQALLQMMIITVISELMMFSHPLICVVCADIYHLLVGAGWLDDVNHHPPRQHGKSRGPQTVIFHWLVSSTQ